MRFKFFLFLVLWVPSSTLWAGQAFLNDAEIAKLRGLVQTSNDASIWGQTIQRQATEALGESPNPIGQIQTAGKLQGSAEKTKTQEALKDIYRLTNLTMAYALTGREDFRSKTAEYVLAWAKTCQPPENPIDATNLEILLEAYDLVRPTMAGPDQLKVDNWVRSVAKTLIDSDDPKRGTYWNNWKSHRVKIVALAAYTLGDIALESWSLETVKDLLDKNLNPDGTTLDFMERDALHYQVYDLEPLLVTAILFQRTQNQDLYDLRTSTGASLKQCVAFVVPFAKGEKTHAEYVHTMVKFDLQRAQNHEKGHGIGENFDPKAALKCLALAQFFEPDLKGLVGTLAGKPDTAYPTLQILLNDVTRPTTGSSTKP